jgi:Ca2+/Na+ antiporter
VIRLDWPLLILVTWIATAFLWRGRLGRVAGVLLLLCYVIYVILHVLVR